MQLVLQIITLIGSVAMLMYGLKVMSEALQKMAGSTMHPADPRVGVPRSVFALPNENALSCASAFAFIPGCRIRLRGDPRRPFCRAIRTFKTL